MRAFLVWPLLLFMMVNSVFAVDAQGLMAQGNGHYEKGEFESAITSYEKVLATDMVSTALHYNLGCAYFSEKEYGKAILQFEKARQLSPRDPDVLHNLEYSRLFLKDRFELPEPMPFIAWFKALRKSLSLAELKLLEQILFSLLILGIILSRLTRGNSIGRVITPATIVTGVLLLVVGGWLMDRSIALNEKHAILLVDEAEVTSAPIPGSSTLFVIHEGTSAEILDATDAWYELRLEDGKTGWIIHEAVGLY
ncbi:MAG: tetratricopeptide repeat protein [FCB group bacterium]|nr:tetratricopeptide repeat protein [FCB group bacterium]MBL7027876.1 tetratricopeptide repeat protein [Candidatus Neomarinimicrobiota bacterium]MBL7121885.1 tetratricopeptide repeat protein [Candidatus Neomarinimicrobiota bacterium]